MPDYVDTRLRMRSTSEGRASPIWPQPSEGRQYRPHLRVGNGEYLGVAFVSGPAILQPGDEGDVTLALIYAETGVDYSGLQPGATFVVVEGPNTVASGSVIRRYQSDRDWHVR